MYKPIKISTSQGIRWEISFHVGGRGSKRIRRRFAKRVEADLFIKNFFSKNKELAISEDEENSLSLKTEYEYWRQNKQGSLSISQISRAEKVVFDTIKSYGNKKILEFNNSFLSELRSDLLSMEIKPATVNRKMNVLTAIINFSFKHKRIRINPCDDFGLLTEFREEISFWELSETSSFLKLMCKKYKGQHRWVYLVYLLALNTGARAGEIWGLKVKDIHFSRGFINIERQFLKDCCSISHTKGKNIRKVPCNKVLANELKTHIILAGLTREDFIFQSKNKTPIRHSNFVRRKFSKDIIESKSSKIRFHDLRHTALTLMVDSGVRLDVVKSIAGHADIKTTMKYVHLLGDSIENVAGSFVLV